MELNELRKIAEAATPGPWEAYDRGIGYEVYQSGSDWCLNSGQRETFSKSDATHIATFDPPTVLALLSRLEQAEARVKLLESGIVSELATTSVNAAQTIGSEVSWISEAILKMGYAGLTEQLEQAEQDRVKLRNRLDAMRRQRDGYRNQLRKAQTNQGENNE